MSTAYLLGGVAVVVLIVLAAVLAMAETALTHLGRARAAAIEDYARQLQARRRAQAASANRERPAANNRSAPAPAN